MPKSNRGITIRDVAEDVGISIGSSHSIFSNVCGMKRVAAKFVLHHDNTPAYTSFFSQKQYQTMSHPSCSPNLVPCH